MKMVVMVMVDREAAAKVRGGGEGFMKGNSFWM